MYSIKVIEVNAYIIIIQNTTKYVQYLYKHIKIPELYID